MAENDRSSLLALFAAHYAELVSHLTRRLGSPAAAADVAQDIYLRLRGLRTTPEVRNPRAYLFRLAGNLAVDRLRGDVARGRYLVPSDGCDDRPSTAPDPEAILDYKQRLRLLTQAIAELPPRCREVFLLHKFDGPTHGEIAERLGITKSMVEKHVMKALAHCRYRLGTLLD